MTTSFNKALLPVVAILILVVAALFVLRSKLTHLKQPQTQGGASVGEAFADFRITRFGDGQSALFSEFQAANKARVTLVNFWASWCDSCLVEMPSFVRLRKDFKERGFEIVAINVDENPDVVLPPLLKRLGIDFPVYTDPQGEVAALFDVHAIPLTVLFDAKRRSLFIESGGRDWNSPEFRSMLEKWLSKPTL